MPSEEAVVYAARLTFRRNKFPAGLRKRDENSDPYSAVIAEAAIQNRSMVMQPSRRLNDRVKSHAGSPSPGTAFFVLIP